MRFVRLLVLLPLAASLLPLSGCFSVDSAKAPPVMGSECLEHVAAYNYGWRLFGCIPVVCGNRNLDSWCPFTFFMNEVKHEYVYEKIEDLARSRDADLRDVVLYADNDVFFDFYYTAIPWIITYHEVNGSATLVKKGSGREGTK